MTDTEKQKGEAGIKEAKGPVRRFLPIVLLVLFLGFAWFKGWHEYFSLSHLISHREWLGHQVEAHWLLAGLSFIAIYAFLVAISFPGASYLTITAGLLFGGVVGSMLSVVAATIGSVAIFLIARSSFGDFLEARAGPFVSRMVDGFKRDSFQYLLTIRLTPVFPFWAVNIVPALLNMRLIPYTAATFLGIIPGTFAYAYIGSGLDSIIAAQQEANPGCVEAGTCSIDPKALITTEIVIAMLALAVISILPLVIRKLRADKPKHNGAAPTA